MGKEWYWSKSHRKGSSNGGNVADTREKNTTQVMGCMSSIFHLFDLHQLLFTTRPAGGAPSLSSSSTEVVHWTETPRREPTKGVEAPRNSLELDVTSTATKLFTSSPIKPDDQDDYEIPFSIQIVPRRTLEEQMEEERSSQAMSSARSISKGNVVAELMGLETLPFSTTFSPRTRSLFDEQAFLSPSVASTKKKHQYNRWKKNRGQEQQEMGFKGRRVALSQSPSPRCPLQPKNCNSMVDDDARCGTRSLPETPRASFGRRSWDSDPRLSLQSNAPTTNCYCNNNKENMINTRGNQLSDLAMQELKRVFEEYPSVFASPGAAAKTKMRSQDNFGDEQSSSPSNYAREIVRQMKDSVSRRIERGRSSSESPTTTPRNTVAITKQYSPRSIRVVEVAEQKQVSSPREKSTPKPKQSQLASSSPLQPPPQKCRKVSCERFNERLKKSPENVATKATGVISSSNSTASIPRPPRRPSKKSIPPPSAVIDFKREKVQPSSPPELQKPPPIPEEFEYVKIVLERAGIRSHTSLPFAVRWNSPSHPLDPIIFHQLELTSIATDSGPLRHRCNRKLLFDLVDEILADILYPYLVENPRRRGSLKPTIPTNWDSLLNLVWLKIRRYPQAKCEVIQDIDALVELDLPDPNIRQLFKHPAVEDESENITVEIQRSIIDHLVEITTILEA